MFKTVIMVLLTGILLGCSSSKPVPGQPIKITNVQAELRGKQIKDRPDMADICKAFSLTEQQVQSFYQHAIEIESEEAEQYRRLPCYTTGTVKINKERYSWLIRAGGIGEFYNKDKRILKVCGKNCCSKIPGVC